MTKKTKKFLGSLSNEEDAAKLYDYHAILTKGIRVHIFNNFYRQKRILHIQGTKSRLLLINS